MKLRRKKISVLLFFVLIVCVVVAAFIIWGGGKAKEKSFLKIMADNVDLQVKDIRYTEVGDDKAKWEIKADTAKYMKKENLALFDRITVKLVMADGKTFVMNGDKGRMKTDTRDIEILGNVEITSDNGDCFKTDALLYSSADKKFSTPSAVKMDNARMQVRAVGMSLSLITEKLSLLSKVKARIEPNSVVGLSREK
jgi:LPS export ABC transporter protein LptC